VDLGRKLIAAAFDDAARIDQDGEIRLVAYSYCMIGLRSSITWE
jgi:hypothetical protein